MPKPRLVHIELERDWRERTHVTFVYHNKGVIRREYVPTFNSLYRLKRRHLEKMGTPALSIGTNHLRLCYYVHTIRRPS